MKWTVFLGLYGLQIGLTIRPFTKSCLSLDFERWVIYLGHHLFDVFLVWSFLFLTKPIEFLAHFLLAIGVAIHWATNNNECELTVYMNKLCGYPADQWLDSIKNKLGLRSISEYFLFYWLAALLVQDLYNVFPLISVFAKQSFR